MQKENFFLSNNGIGVSFCIENNVFTKINLSNSDKISFPEKTSYNKFFERFFDYLGGKIVNFDVDFKLLDFSVFSDFQLKVYRALIKITYGNFISYEGLAEKLGNKNLKRAVGRILGLNPFPIIIPCHRVLPKNFLQKNSIGGFSAGLNIKEKLLKIEGIL
ncbi:MAG: methylated-DNA--[protein]-cysteine S-methyltransferase [Brevinematales bacterium]|nr:methylated-DNA--[protein]-cysteine S-methyltransferase [Brevinematales bacterium]